VSARLVVEPEAGRNAHPGPRGAARQRGFRLYEPAHAHPPASGRRRRIDPTSEVVLPAIPVLDPPSPRYRLMQRARDLVGGVALLVLTLPLQAAIAALVAADSPGPVIFRQLRVGEGGRLFVFYKFRTMYSDARERFPELYAYEYTADQVDTMTFKLPFDPRLTRVGRHLRRTSLDELPNLINVVRGEMSLVGPRPEIPEMVPYYRADQLAKFSVKPGLTGLAQVSGRNILRFQQTIAADLEYVQTRSLRLDLRLLAKTALVVLLRAGAL
jgi:lipopolysaccharide/colanic/teichoic acid biosynthesis glycosyltransferase